MIRVDLHTHTYASHGQDTVLEMYYAGLNKGLAVLGFSEHSPRPFGYDYPCEYREHLVAHFPKYLADVKALQADPPKPARQIIETNSEVLSVQATNVQATIGTALDNAKGMQVLLGLELDWIDGEEAFMQRVVQAVPYDYVIGGLHFIGKWGFDADAADWGGMDDATYAEICVRYYTSMRRMAESGLVNIVAHPDLVKIFTHQRFEAWLAKPESLPLVGEALKAMAAHGVSMEISSAGLRKPCASIYPCPAIMSLAKDCGLRISFASDSHCTKDVAYGFETLRLYAYEFGFTEAVYYVAGKPHVFSF